MSTEVLQTFWRLDLFECVLVATDDRYAVQVFASTQALFTESARTIEQAHKRAKQLFAILRPAE
jgi:hypothetical protein